MNDDSIVEKLCSRWRMKSPEGAITKALYSTFPELATVKPPVDLSTLANKRGIANVQLCNMKADGMISLREAGGYAVRLNKLHSLNRRRFTLGHEIGHTFFFELDDQRVAYRTTSHVVDGDLQHLVTSAYEEILCNIAASEILLPQDVFTETASRLRLSAQSLVTLGTMFRASLWSVSRKLCDFGKHNIVIALWEYDAELDCYTTLWIVRSGRKSPQRLQVDRTNPFYSALGIEMGFRGRRWISLGGPMDDYFVDSLLLQNSNPRRIITLLILEKNPESLVSPLIDSPKTKQRSFF